jgi:CRISPR/Cas system endoribonuclease Cas6 (RAMP superfamily)
VVYDGEADLMAPAVPPWSGVDLPRSPVGADRVTLEFVTPTRLRQDADLVVRPEFATLATALLRRVSVLAEVHCGARTNLDARAILESASTVRAVESNLRWHDWERYSARQDTRMALGGFVGRVHFEGNLAPWWPLLRVGEVLHVGKGTAFGLGKFRLVEKP